MWWLEQKRSITALSGVIVYWGAFLNSASQVMSERVPKSVWLILALLMLSACILRFTQLEYAPAGGQGDVSWVGINALDWVDRGVWPFYVRELYSPEFFPVYLTGLLLPITGISQLPQRIITATSGVLLVLSL